MTRIQALRFQAISLLLSNLLFATGCYNTYQFKPTELHKLDGFPDRPLSPKREEAETQPVSLKPRYILLERDGKSTLEVLPDDELTLKLSDQRKTGGQFSQIRIDPSLGLFEGRTVEGRQIKVSLSNIKLAEVSRFSTGNTIGAVLLTAFVFLGLAFAIGVTNIRG